MFITKIKLKLNKYRLIAVIAVVALASVFLYFYNIQRTEKNVFTPSNTDQPANLSPPTKEDGQRVNDNKNKIVERDESLNKQQNTPQNGGKKSVKPTITYAGAYGDTVEVGAFVDGIYEDSGTCTAVFTRDDLSLNKTVAAITDVKSVSCPMMSAQISEFQSKGIWLIKVKYDSPTATGISDTRNLEIK